MDQLNYNMLEAAMHLKYPVSFQTLLRCKNLRLYLFNKQCYRLEKEEVVRQISVFQSGKTHYQDFGQPIPLERVFSQIKLVYRKDTIIAVRKESRTCLLSTEENCWGWRTNWREKKTRGNHLLRAYHEKEALEFHCWLKQTREYVYQHKERLQKL